MGTYQEYENQHKTEFIVDKLIYGSRRGIPLHRNQHNCLSYLKGIFGNKPVVVC